MRYAAKIDANQPDIVAALRMIGCSVQSMAGIGDGCPDLLVGFKGKFFPMNLCMEVKDGAKVPSAQQLTKAEAEWFDTWRGQKIVVRSVAEALAVVQEARG